MNSDLPAGDPSTQWQWHEAHRDLAKNMYRSSYADMSHGREASTRSDYPSGYGGHVPSVRFDVLHRNTKFDRDHHLRRSDPSRDAHPSFHDQLNGVPTICKFPRGARKNPTAFAIPGDGSTSMAVPPWGITLAVREVPSHRNAPATMTRSFSSPALRTSGALLTGSPQGGSPHGQQGGRVDQGQLSPQHRAYAMTPHPGNPGSPSGGSAKCFSRGGGVTYADAADGFSSNEADVFEAQLQ